MDDLQADLKIIQARALQRKRRNTVITFAVAGVVVAVTFVARCAYDDAREKAQARAETARAQAAKEVVQAQAATTVAHADTPRALPPVPADVKDFSLVDACSLEASRRFFASRAASNPLAGGDGFSKVESDQGVAGHWVKFDSDSRFESLTVTNVGFRVSISSTAKSIAEDGCSVEKKMSCVFPLSDREKLSSLSLGDFFTFYAYYDDHPTSYYKPIECRFVWKAN